MNGPASRQGGRIPSAALILACMTATADAKADQGAVLLLLEPNAGPLGVQVRDELAALGLTVRVKSLPQARTDPEAYLAEARAAKAAAAVRVRPKPEATEIWVIDRVSGKTLFRQVPTSTSPDDTVLATKTAELLRASLIEVDVPGSKTPEIQPPPAVHPPLPTPRPARAVVTVGGGPAFGDTLGTTGFLWIGAQHRAWRSLWVGGRLALPILRPTREGPEGASTVTLSNAGVVFEAAPWRDHWRVSPALGVLVGASWLRATGDAGPLYVSQTADVVSLCAGVRAAVSTRLVGPVRLRLDAGLTALAPRPRLLFVGRVVGTAPDPFPEVGGALEVEAW